MRVFRFCGLGVKFFLKVMCFIIWFLDGRDVLGGCKIFGVGRMVGGGGLFFF